MLAAATTVHEAAGLAPMEVARRVHEAGIEVLFDLRSYGGGANSDLFEFRPAPVQVNWLAYPATAGAAWTDYVLADAVALPAPLRWRLQSADSPACLQACLAIASARPRSPSWR